MIDASQFLFWISLIIYLMNVAAFSWALKNFFRNEGQLPPKMRQLKSIAAVIALIQIVTILFSPRASLVLQIMGFVLCLLSAVLFWITLRFNQQNPLPVAFSKLETNSIRSTGPYKFIRHPFYLSYILTWMAAPFTAESWALSLTSFLMLAAYIKLIKDEESALLSGAHAETYQKYRSQTGALIPKPWAFSLRKSL